MSVPKILPQVQPSAMDQRHIDLLRANIAQFLTRAGTSLVDSDTLLLEVAPQQCGGARQYFPAGVRWETLDINPLSGCTHIADLCATNPHLPAGRYDVIVITEVLEHTIDPFRATAELYRLLKPGGVLLLSTPFNLRIHGPLPDCWRFTEHGLRVLLQKFDIIEFDALETPDRPLMPIQYTVVASKPK